MRPPFDLDHVHQMALPARLTPSSNAPTDRQALRVWTPPDADGAHGIITPVRTAPPIGTGLPADLLACGLDDETAAYAHELATADEPIRLSESEREFVRNRVPLAVFYMRYLSADRAAAAASGRLSRRTIGKERQALARWNRFSRPDTWRGVNWPGVPIGDITGRYVETVLRTMTEALSAATVRSTWNHLRVILRTAAAWGVIPDAPRPAVRWKGTDRPVSVYQPEQLEAAYHALAPAPDLQTAFVVAVNAGPRPVDLFALKWENVRLDGDRPTLSFRSRKTGKPQSVPLAPVTAAHIDRLPRSGPYLFPGRSLPESGDPERSRPARQRRADLARLLAPAGLTYAKPFQAARATCNTRLNTVRDGAGVWVLGHGLTLNARSYMEPTELVWAAVLAVPQPAAFLTIFQK